MNRTSNCKSYVTFYFKEAGVSWFIYDLILIWIRFIIIELFAKKTLQTDVDLPKFGAECVGMDFLVWVSGTGRSWNSTAILIGVCWVQGMQCCWKSSYRMGMYMG